MHRALARNVSFGLVWVLGAALSGCGGAASPPGSDEEKPLVPFSGVVTYNGKPLQGAMITFLPVDERGTIGQGDTDAEGKFSLKYQGRPGTAPGPYKVSINYRMAPGGVLITRGMMSSLVEPPEVTASRELLAPEYSDLGQTKLSLEVGKSGGNHAFALEGPELVPPAAPEAEPEASPESEPAPAPADAKPAADEKSAVEPTKPMP